MKKGLTALLTLIFTFSILATIYAADTVNASDAVRVTIDGRPQSYAVPPQIINDRTFLPLRAVCESLNITVDYNASTKTATMTHGTRTIIHTINTNKLTINGTPKTFDTPSTIIEERTLVPLRMLAEAISAKVDWLPDTRTAVITTNSSEAAEGLSTAGKTPIHLDANTTVYREDILTHIGSQEVLTNQTVILDESQKMTTIQVLADRYKPFDPAAVSEDILYNTAKGFLEGLYNIDYTTTTANDYWAAIYPYFNNAWRSGNGSTGRQYVEALVEAAKTQQVKMTSIFVSDPSLVYTVNENVALINSSGTKTDSRTPWAVRGTLYYKFDSIRTDMTSGQFWTTTDGEVAGKWYQIDVEVRMGINENIKPYKAVTSFSRVFQIGNAVEVK